MFNHENVAEKERSQRVFNSSFWVDRSARPDLAGVSPRTSHMKISLSSSKNNEMEMKEEIEVSDPLLFKH